jgi:hypothetical protein
VGTELGALGDRKVGPRSRVHGVRDHEATSTGEALSQGEMLLCRGVARRGYRIVFRNQRQDLLDLGPKSSIVVEDANARSGQPQEGSDAILDVLLARDRRQPDDHGTVA